MNPQFLLKRFHRYLPVFGVFILMLTVWNSHSAPLKAASSAYQNAVLADGPISYWRLDETSGTTAFDTSGRNTNNGTLNGSITLGVPGALANDTDTAMAFNGVDSYVDIPATPLGGLNLNFDFTLEAWANPSVVAGVTAQVVNKGRFNYRLGLNNNVWRGSVFFHGIAYSVESVNPAKVNAWTYLVLTRSGTTLTLYIDGVSVATQTVPAGHSDLSLNVGVDIGRKSSSATDFFRGSIDEVAIYNVPLSPSQVLAHFNAAH